MLASEYDVGKDITRTIFTENLVKRTMYAGFVLHSLTGVEK
jgi:hypothetical protein